MTTAEGSLLTYEQTAKQLGCSLKTVQRRVREGSLTPQLRPGSTNRWIPAEQVAALAETAGADQ